MIYLDFYTQIIAIYAVSCRILYYLMYTYKKIIFKSKFLAFIVIMIPFIYFFVLKFYNIS